MAEEIVQEYFGQTVQKLVLVKDYLWQEWTEREVEKFVNRTVEMLSTLKRYPEMCRPSAKRKNVRIGILDKHTQIFYHYKPRKNQIEVLFF